jgi:hypothetical protein
MIKRIEEQLEEAYEARFFIVIAAEGESREEARASSTLRDLGRLFSFEITRLLGHAFPAL